MSRPLELDVCSLFTYYSDGRLFNKYTRSSRAVKDVEAGSINKAKGYRRIKIGGVNYATHRLVYLFWCGYMPKMIDHIDGNKLNNRIENLRECTNMENSYNSVINYSSTTGVKGVTFIKAKCKYRARIQANGKCHHLGYFDNLQLAEFVVSEARDILHKEFANVG